MASDRQIAANRANARKSTGPRTAKGKSKVALNALRHGLRSGGSPPGFEAAVAELAQTFCAEDPTLNMDAAEAYAGATLRQRLVRGALEDLHAAALAQVTQEGPPELREDLARLAVLEGPGRPLLAYQERAAGMARRALKRM